MKHLVLSLKLATLLLFLFFSGRAMAAQSLWVGQKYTCEISQVGSAVLLRNVVFTTSPSGLLTVTGSGFYRDVTPSSYFSGTAYVKVSYEYSYGAGYTKTSQTWAIQCVSNPLNIYSSTMDLKVNGGAYISPSLTYTNSYSSSVKYSYSGYDSSIISVSSDGKVTGKKAGTTNVTVTSTHSANQCTCKVTVSAEHTHSLTAHTATAATCTTAGNKAYWYCSGCGKYFSDSSGTTETTLSAVTIAALGHNYKSTDNGNGTHTTACSRCSSKTTGAHTYVNGVCSVCGSKESSATIKVSGITLSASTASLTVGDTKTITATVTPTNATNKSVTWSSSNNAVATVNNGTITAVAEGTVNITATAADGSGVKATCSVTVKANGGGTDHSDTQATLEVNKLNGTTDSYLFSDSPVITWSDDNGIIVTTSKTSKTYSISSLATLTLGKKATAVANVMADKTGETTIYSVNGIRQDKLHKGLNIIKSKDGSVHKIIVK